MNMINLSRYMRDGLFLEHGGWAKNFDLILIEDDKYIGDKISGYNNIKVMKDEIKKYSGLSDMLLSLANNRNKVLIILDKMNLAPMFQNLGDFDNIIVVNLFTGLSSVSYKIGVENQDIVIMDRLGFEVFEPYDLESFNKRISNTPDLNNKVYIRLSSNYCPYTVNLEQNLEAINGLLSLTGLGLNGDSTVIFMGSMAYAGIVAINELQNEGINCDVFLMSKYRIELGDEIKNSLNKNKKLLLFVDHYYSTVMEKYFKSILKDSGIDNIDINIFYPNYSAVSTVMEEYQQEQAEFDSSAIKSYILGVV